MIILDYETRKLTISKGSGGTLAVMLGENAVSGRGADTAILTASDGVETLFEKTAEIANDGGGCRAEFVFSADDTRDIPIGSYLWELTIVNGADFDRAGRITANDRGDGVFPALSYGRGFAVLEIADRDGIVRQLVHDDGFISVNIYPKITAESFEGVWAAEKGGTGADTVQGARKNLGFGEVETESVAVTAESGTETDAVSFVPEEDGTYLISTICVFGEAEGGERRVSIIRDGETAPDARCELPYTADGETYVSITAVIDLTAGETLKVATEQDSGTALTVNVSAKMMRIG